jgi:hypothetical protein
MTSTGVFADQPLGLTDQQIDHVREGGPHRQAQRQTQHQAYVQVHSPAGRPLRVHDVCYLLLLGAVQLAWMALLGYGLVRLIA